MLSSEKHRRLEYVGKRLAVLELQLINLEIAEGAIHGLRKLVTEELDSLKSEMEQLQHGQSRQDEQTQSEVRGN